MSNFTFNDLMMYIEENKNEIVPVGNIPYRIFDDRENRKITFIFTPIMGSDDTVWVKFYDDNMDVDVVTCIDGIYTEPRQYFIYDNILDAVDFDVLPRASREFFRDFIGSLTTYAQDYINDLWDLINSKIAELNKFNDTHDIKVGSLIMACKEDVDKSEELVNTIRENIEKFERTIKTYEWLDISNISAIRGAIMRIKLQLGNNEALITEARGFLKMYGVS